MKLCSKKEGMTLVEMLIVLAIILIMIAVLIGGTDFIKQIFKAEDAQRKKDLQRLKVVMEEYYDDRGCYPVDVGLLNNPDSCKSEIMAPYIYRYPCFKGEPYLLEVANSPCPQWFRFLVNLDNTADASLDTVGCGSGGCRIGFIRDGQYSIDTFNFGVSSDNILWYEGEETCDEGCYVLTGSGCNSASQGCVQNCYSNHNCLDACVVTNCE